MATVRDKSGNNPGVDKALGGDEFAITPSDTIPQRSSVDLIYVGVTGNITVKNHLGETVLYSNVPVGDFFLGGVKYVMATGTTATGLVAKSNKAFR